MRALLRIYQGINRYYSNVIFLHYLYIENIIIIKIQSNLKSSNPDGSFTMADSNLFLSPAKFFRYLKKTNT